MMHQRAGIKIVMGSRPGATMYVLGNGPSLDVEFMKSLNPADCIGVNRIMLHQYHPKYMVFVDKQVWYEQKAALLSTGCSFFFGVDLWDQVDHLPLDRSMCFEYPFDTAPGLLNPILHHGWLTGYYAAAIAARMVYPGGTVVLMGMDLQYPDDGPDHSYGSGKQFDCHHGRFPEAIEAFKLLKAASAPYVQFQVAGDSALLEYFFQRFSLDGVPPVG